MSESETTTITLKKTTRDRLAQIGRLDQSFDDVVNALLSEHSFITEIEPALERARSAYGAYTRNYQSGDVHTKMVATLPDFFHTIEKFIETVKAR